jgi:hypothetical protein
MYFYSHFSNHISSTHWLASDSFTRENFPREEFRIRFVEHASKRITTAEKFSRFCA